MSQTMQKTVGHSKLSAERTRLLDELILNISNPRNAERLRMIQVVEDQLDSIQAEVRAEVQARLRHNKNTPTRRRVQSRYGIYECFLCKYKIKV